VEHPPKNTRKSNNTNNAGWFLLLGHVIRVNKPKQRTVRDCLVLGEQCGPTWHHCLTQKTNLQTEVGDTSCIRYIFMHNLTDFARWYGRWSEGMLKMQDNGLF
jgi:hypothetical protein